MKKIVSLLLSLMIFVCFSCSASAEAFTIHNGTTFGMTEEEVFALEKEHGFSREDSDTYGPNVKGKVAGFEDSTVYYGFNSDGKLVSVTYNIGQDSNTSRYNTIYDGLQSKYGNPTGDFILFDVGADNMLIKNYSILSGLLAVSIPNLDQWIVPIDNGYVCITAINYYVKQRSDIREVWISYEFVTEETYNSRMAEENKDKNQANDDL